MSILESHKNYQPRLAFFYLVLGTMMVVLFCGLAYRQLIHSHLYAEDEKRQNQRRILIPGPRGNIYDREGRLLVGNRARFAVVLYLAELQSEFAGEFSAIKDNYGHLPASERPSRNEFRMLARASVVQRYLNTVNGITGRRERVDPKALERHFGQRLLLPYMLIEDLQPEEYARLIERLPVESPVQVHTSSTRYYPYGSAAAHVLGHVTAAGDAALPESMAGDELMTFSLKSTTGRDGLELKHDDHLQGKTGGLIYMVDPLGFKVDPPLEQQLPVQGNNLTTSLDIDLQLAAEKALEGLRGAAVALDVRSGEILVMASKPGYDLNEFSPSLSAATYARIEEERAWPNRAIQGLYPPGSTFKLITAIAGLKTGKIFPQSQAECTGYFKVGRSGLAPCHLRSGHGVQDLRNAISNSCNVFFYQHGIEIGPEAIAAEARRFHLHEPTGVELPSESTRMIVPDPAWKREYKVDAWFPGDTTNYAIGQGFLQVTPVQMAAFAASLARRETLTRPTILHQPGRNASAAPGNTPLDLSAADYQLILDGMEQAVQYGTAKLAQVPGLRIAGKTGTAQASGNIELAVLLAFAPIESPEIAVFVLLEGAPGQGFGGGRMAGPVGKAIFEAYAEKRRAAGTRALAGH